MLALIGQAPSPISIRRQQVFQRAHHALEEHAGVALVVGVVRASAASYSRALAQRLYASSCSKFAFTARISPLEWHDSARPGPKNGQLRACTNSQHARRR